MNNTDIFNPHYINGLMRLKAYQLDYYTLTKQNKEFLVMLLNEDNYTNKKSFLRDTFIINNLLVFRIYDSIKGELSVRLNNLYEVGIKAYRYSSSNIRLSLTNTTLEFEGVQKII